MITELFNNFANLLTIAILSYFTFNIVMLFNKKQRILTQQTNIKLNELRNIKNKTIEQQKEFINLKYPKKPKFKFSWKWMLVSVGYLILFMGIYMGWIYLFQFFHIILKFWQAMLIIFILPIVVNIILKKFHLDKNNISNLF